MSAVALEDRTAGAPTGRDARPAPDPLTYRPFSPRLAPTLTALGGGLSVLGALGTWVRATATAAEGAPPVEVSTLVGRAEGLGWVLAMLGVVLIVGSLAWSSAALGPKLFPVLASVGVIALELWLLGFLDRRAATLAADAQRSASFATYHAGFGWGAWLLLVAAVALGLGVLAGTLRELDLRRSAA